MYCIFLRKLLMFEESRHGTNLTDFFIWVMLPSLRGQVCRKTCPGHSVVAWCSVSIFTFWGQVLLAGFGAVCIQLQWADADRAAAVHCWSLPTAAGGSSQDGSVICPKNFQCWCVWRNPQKAVWGHKVLRGHGTLGSFPDRVKIDVPQWRTLHVIPARTLHKSSLPLEFNSSVMCVHAFLKDKAQKTLSHSEIFVL